MGNRIIKESIRTSRSVADMTDFQFRVWVYLITYADDFGRGSADPEILKGMVFTRRRGVTEATIEKALADLANMGMIHLYTVDGEPFFCFPSWGKHQRVQQKRSKFPGPKENNDGPPHPTVTHGDPPPESESEFESESEPEKGFCTEPGCAGSAPPAVLLPLNGGTEYPVTEEELAEFGSLYPAVDVAQELRNMRGWLLANPNKRKTKGGVRRFINGWLAREQDRGGARGPAKGGAGSAGGRRPGGESLDLGAFEQHLSARPLEGGEGP